MVKTVRSCIGTTHCIARCVRFGCRRMRDYVSLTNDRTRIPDSMLFRIDEVWTHTWQRGLPVPHSMSPVCRIVPYMSTSLGTHLVWSVSTRFASGLTCCLMSLKTASPLVIINISRCLHPPVPCAPKHHSMHTIRVFTRGGRTFACRGTNKRPETCAPYVRYMRGAYLGAV